MKGSLRVRQNSRWMTKLTIRVETMPMAYSPNITSPCRLIQPQTFVFGMRAAMIRA